MHDALASDLKNHIVSSILLYWSNQSQASFLNGKSAKEFGTMFKIAMPSNTILTINVHCLKFAFFLNLVLLRQSLLFIAISLRHLTVYTMDSKYSD
jgi:hypothetical protein